MSSLELKFDSNGCLVVDGTPNPEASHIVRVQSGLNSTDFDHLHPDKNRLVAFVGKVDLLLSMVGRNVHEILLDLGFGPEYLKDSFSRKVEYRLLFCEEVDESHKVLPATWEHLIDSLAERHVDLPTLWGKHAISTPAGDRFYPRVPKEAPLKPSLSETIAAAQELGLQEKLDMIIRSWLCHFAGAFHLFSGTGVLTRELHDQTVIQTGVPEYITANGPISDIPAQHVHSISMPFLWTER